MDGATDEHEHRENAHLVRSERAGTEERGPGRPEFRGWLWFRDYTATMMQPSPNAPTTVDRLTTVLSYGVLLLLAYLLFRVFQPFLVPLAWAGVFVVFFHPAYERVARRMRASRAALVCTTGVTVLLIMPSLLLLTLFVREGIAASTVVQRTLLEGETGPLVRLSEWLNQHLPVPGNVDLPGLFRQGAEKLAAVLAAQIGPVLRNIAVFVFDFFTTLFALFYFFRDGDRLMSGLRNLLPFDVEHRERVLKESRELIVASVLISIVVAGVQGLFGGIAFAVVKLPTPFFWGVAMAFFSLVPVVGTALVWVPAALWLVFAGHWGRALTLALICSVVVGMVDNVLRPALLHGRTQMNGLLVFVSLLGGLHVFGLLGLVLGPIIVATTASLLDAYAGASSQLRANRG
jgi:predicted PurR-regulated permease PerM